MDMITTDKKVVLVTGCSSGFGRLSAVKLARRGHRVFAGMRVSDGRNKTNKDSLLKLAKDESLELKVVELDVTNDQSVDSAVSNVVSDAGHIDVLVNNAGIMYVGVTEAYTVDQARHQMETNFLGVCRMNRAVLGGMRKRKSGLIIHVTSLAGRLVFPYFGIYCASKFAVEALAEAYRYELVDWRVDSVIVEPGPFATSLIANIPEEDDRKRLAEYGDEIEIPKNMIKSFLDFYNSGKAPSAQEVADRIAGMVVAPHGSLPLRTVVGVDYGTDKLNSTCLPIQQALLDTIGMKHLTELA